MKKALEALRKEMATFRAGRATPSILDKVMVDYSVLPRQSVKLPVFLCPSRGCS